MENWFLFFRETNINYKENHKIYSFVFQGDDYPFKWKNLDDEAQYTDPATLFNATFTDLASNTKYRLRMNVTYKSDESLAWPRSSYPWMKTTCKHKSL